MIERAAEAAVAQACARLIAAADELPGDVIVERIAQGVTLTGRGLARRRIEDVRVRGFALGARR